MHHQTEPCLLTCSHVQTLVKEQLEPEALPGRESVSLRHAQYQSAAHSHSAAFAALPAECFDNLITPHATQIELAILSVPVGSASKAPALSQEGLGLGIEQMTALEFLRSYMLKAVASLPAGPRDAALLRMLEDLPRLRRIDPTFIDDLRTV